MSVNINLYNTLSIKFKEESQTRIIIGVKRVNQKLAICSTNFLFNLKYKNNLFFTKKTLCVKVPNFFDILKFFIRGIWLESP